MADFISYVPITINSTPTTPTTSSFMQGPLAAYLLLLESQQLASETTLSTGSLSSSTQDRPYFQWTSSGNYTTPSYTSSTSTTTTAQVPTRSTVTPAPISGANRTVKFLGKDVNLQLAVDIITRNLAITANNPVFTHTCTRHVTNALKGVTDPHKHGGISGPSEMYNLLKRDGWTDVLGNNYTPQIGDVYVVWGAKGGKYGMHTSMWNGKQWLSYNADNHGKSTPWYFNLRGKEGVNMHIMRYLPGATKALKGTKLIKKFLR